MAHMIEGENRVQQAVLPPHTCAVALLFLPKKMNFKKPSPNPIYSKKVVTKKLQLQICVICKHYVWLLGICAVSSAWEDCHFFLWAFLVSSSLTYYPGLTVCTIETPSSLLISPKPPINTVKVRIANKFRTARKKLNMTELAKW